MYPRANLLINNVFLKPSFVLFDIWREEFYSSSDYELIASQPDNRMSRRACEESTNNQLSCETIVVQI